MKQSSPAGEAECEHALWLRCLASAVRREQRVVPGNRGRGAVLVVPLEIVPVTGPLEGNAVHVGTLNPSHKMLPRLKRSATGVRGWVVVWSVTPGTRTRL
jgi:hypothetical protein